MVANPQARRPSARRRIDVHDDGLAVDHLPAGAESHGGPAGPRRMHDDMGDAQFVQHGLTKPLKLRVRRDSGELRSAALADGRPVSPAEVRIVEILPHRLIDGREDAAIVLGLSGVSARENGDDAQKGCGGALHEIS